MFLQHASIVPDSNILIVEKTKGLVLAAVAQRLNARGAICLAFFQEVKKPLNQITCFHQMNLCQGKNENITMIEHEKLVGDETKKGTFTQLLKTLSGLL